MIKLAMIDTKNVRTRFAPSPTGELHIGGIRTALYSYALARQNGGQFILRIEDTDQKRYVSESENRIMADLKAYGITWDEGPFFQTQRLDIYQKYIKELLDKGLAYYCFCTKERLEQVRESQKTNHQQPKYDKHCLSLTKEEIQKNLDQKIPYTIRLNIPANKTLSFTDIIRGLIKFNTNEIDDQVLIKNDGIPTYHFASIIDDHLMDITHIFRGEEWLSSTPKHILLYQYFGWEMPAIGHLSVFLAEGEQKGKMSKRQGSTQARQFLEEGYLPEATLNFLMLLGWNPGDEREFFTLDEFVKAFDVNKLNKKSVVFDRTKLAYFNGYYLRQKTNQELFDLLKPFIPRSDTQTLNNLIPLLKERISTLKSATEMTNFIFEDVNYSSDLFIQKKIELSLAKEILISIKDLLNSLESFEFTVLQTKLLELIKTNNWNTGQFFMVLRIAICGSPFTLPIVEVLPILGKEKTLKKIDISLNKLTQ